MTELATLPATIESPQPAPDGRVQRPGLVERVHRAGAVCAIIAPPGYGKTSLAQQVLDSRPGARMMSAADQRTPPDSVEPPLLVLDDAQVLTAAQLDQWLTWRDQTEVEQLVLIGRPALARMLGAVASDRTIEQIRANRIGFERDETRAFVQHRVAGDIAEELIHELHALTAGWPSLLDCVVPSGTSDRDLASMLQRDEPPPTAAKLVRGYLLSELSAEDQDLLATASVLRRLEPSSLSAVLNSQEAAAQLLLRLDEADLVTAGADGSPRLRAPWVREALRRGLQKSEPNRIQNAQLAAADTLMESGAGWAVPDIIAHYVEAQKWDKAAAVVDQHADELLERVAAERAQRWLRAVQEHSAPLSLRSTCLLGRVYAQLGQWNEAQTALQQAQSELRDLSPSDSDRRSVTFARIAWLQATMAIQRGRTSEANAYAQRALMALGEVTSDDLRDEADAIIFDLLRLQARLLVDAGKHDGAETALCELIQRAEGTNRRRAQAIAHFELGKLALRIGDALRAVDHLTSALDLVDRQADSDLYNQLETARAEAHIPRGEWEDARSSIANALSVRRRLGHVPAMARTLVTLAELRVADGHAETAEPAFKEALEVIRRGADSHLRAEVAIRYASYLVDTKRVGESIRQLERVKEFVGDLRRFDPSLAGLAESVRGRIARLQLRVNDAQSLLQRAAESLSKQGADHLAAQAYLWLAEVFWSDPPKSDNAVPIRRFVDAACAIANRREYVFGQAERFLPLIGAASALGSVEATQYLRRISGEVPDLASLDGLHLAEGDRQVRYRVYGPDGERLIGSDELSDMLSGLRPEHLAVVSQDGRCDIHHRGQLRSGDLKRVVLPLLRALMKSPGDGLSAPELAQEVWEAEEFNQKARTRLKVAVSRLRELLGQDAKHLKTVPGTGPERSANTRYALDTSLPFMWIEPYE